MPLRGQGILQITSLAFLARVLRSALSKHPHFSAWTCASGLTFAQKIQFLLGTSKLSFSAQILQLLEMVYHGPELGWAQPRTSVAIYRGGPLDYGVGKNYTTVFIIPRMRKRVMRKRVERGALE